MVFRFSSSASNATLCSAVIVLSSASCTTCSRVRPVSVNSPVASSTNPTFVVVVVVVTTRDSSRVAVSSSRRASAAARRCCSKTDASGSGSGSSTSARSATETLELTSESATPSRRGVAFTEKMMWLGSVFLPCASGSVRRITRPGCMANSSRSTTASA